MFYQILFLVFIVLPFFHNLSYAADTQCYIAPVNSNDRRNNKTTLRIVQYNTEWLFIDYYASSDCPGNGCTWKNSSQAEIHLSYVSKIVSELRPDIINICEIEGCDELNMLKTSISYEYLPYLIKGTDTSTGQNVGVLTKIDPVINLYRSDARETYPIYGSKCGYSGTPSTTGVSKHYVTEYNINKINIALIGAHLLAFPTDSARCSQREAQALVLQSIVLGYIKKNFEVILLGDFNDYDNEITDSNKDLPTSQVLDILKGKNIKTNSNLYKLNNIASKMPTQDRYTEWYDKNNDCKSSSNEFSMIDHILVTDNLFNKVSNAFIYHIYDEFCNTYNSDHYPVIIDIDL
uniref:Endonuclease/exonuclease/phosphatase domain-containing protein n=1 Tax=viral metagenome TaxID=1070528 RepID=A0A6C0DLD7_9ZZZZ